MVPFHMKGCKVEFILVISFSEQILKKILIAITFRYFIAEYLFTTVYTY